MLNNVLKQKDVKPYMSYTHSNNGDIKNQYVLIGLNKYYSYKRTDLYAGLLLGYGELKWKYNPLNNSKDNDFTTTSLIGGLQLGLKYPITQHVSVNLNTKFLIHDYKTKFNPNNQAILEIIHDFSSHIGFGLVYKF